MDNRLTATSMYAHGWSTPEFDLIFEQRNRLQAWLDILVALAQAQAELGIIPDTAFTGIASKAKVEFLDEDFVSSETRRTSHSTLGLIRGLQQILDSSSAEYVYFGITVQDLTDTWFGMVMRDSGDLIRADLVNVRDSCVELAKKHRDTPIAGRTHGQLGTPVTFGFKVLTWADEMNRHIERIDGAWACGADFANSSDWVTPGCLGQPLETGSQNSGQPWQRSRHHWPGWATRSMSWRDRKLANSANLEISTQWAASPCRINKTLN